MPLPVITGCSRVAVRGLCQNGQPWVNVLHFAKPTATSRAAFLTALDAYLRNIYTAGGVTGAGTSGWATFGGLSAGVTDYVETQLDGVSASLVVPMLIAGAASGDAMPGDTALVTTLRTGFRGRSNRGRTYWAGLTEANNDSNGHVLPANLVELNANWAACLIAPAGIDALLVVASYLNSTFRVVTNASANGVFDRQRRRKG